MAGTTVARVPARLKSVDWGRAGIFAACTTAALLAARSGLSVGSASKSAVVLPLAAGIAIALGLLALTRFQAYVMTMLFLRSSLDLAKLSGRTAGNTAVSSSSRALDPSSLLAVVFLLAAALWLAAQYRAKGRLPGSPLRRALVLFLLACLISIAGSSKITPSALEGFRICAVVVMFVVLEQMMIDPKRMKEILLAAFLSAAFPLMFTSVGFLLGHPRSEAKGSFTRIVGTFNQSNDFGRYLMLMLIMGVAIYPHVSKRLRMVLGVSVAAMGIFLFLTYTRSALIAAGLGLLIVGLLQSKRLVVGLFIAGVAGLMIVPSLSGRFTDLTKYQSKQAAVGGQPNSGNTLAWRLSYWTEVLPLANRNPVTGIGLNMTQYNTDKAKQPHNDFIRAYVETGIIGFIAYTAMMVALISMGRRAVRAVPEPSLDRGVAIGFLGCAVAFLAVSVVANVISNVVNLWYFFTFAAAASAVVHRRMATDYRFSDSPAALSSR
ncbi:MAG: O-antigen ligase family protein [Actinobacteria bacterium]|nr:O-antigen ligase family protein [Actinomycetota bacterium]